MKTLGEKIRLAIYLFLQDMVNLFSDIYLGNRVRRCFYSLVLKRLGTNAIFNAKIHIEVPANIEIGDHFGVNRGCWISGGGGLIIGNDVMIGPHVILHTANHSIGNSSLPFRLQGHSYEPIKIGDNVWIGAGAIILPGVTIHDNVVIAAGAVVNKDIPAGTLAGGVPAQVIKELSSA